MTFASTASPSSGEGELRCTGPLTRHLLKTTSFMLVMMIFQTLYFLIDLY